MRTDGAADTNPLRWLHENWPRRLHSVKERAVQMNANVLQVSDKEAEEALSKYPTDVEAAAKLIVDERVKKVRRCHGGCCLV